MYLPDTAGPDRGYLLPPPAEVRDDNFIRGRSGGRAGGRQIFQALAREPGEQLQAGARCCLARQLGAALGTIASMTVMLCLLS